MKRGIWITALAALALVWLATGPAAYASNAIAEKEDMVCTSCHDKPGSKLLTDMGKYYELMGSTTGFDQVATLFGKCTTCHVKKPGSTKLTNTGRRFQSLVGDMQGLRELISEQHPFEPTDSGPGDVEGDPPDPINVRLEEILFGPRAPAVAAQTGEEGTQ